jgi:cytochrome c6
MKITQRFMIAAAAVAAGLYLCPQSARAADPGAPIYAQKCAMCHGANGDGQTGMGKMFHLRDLRSAEVQKMTDAELYNIIAKGKEKMPAFEASLGKVKIDEVIAHVRDLAKMKK